MSATWDSKALKATPVSADEVLIIDTADGRNQKRATVSSIAGGFWSRNAGSGFIFPATLTDKVGIGINTPEGTLHVLTRDAGTEEPDADGDDLILENEGNTGYTVAPTVSITAPATPTTATATAVMGTGIGSVTTGLPSGTGYTEGETVILTGVTSSANNARGTITVSAGVIQTITITVRGSGYSTDEALTIVGITSGANDATATSTTTQFVESVTVDTPGSGYVTTPTVSFSGGGGTGAAATAILINTEVALITVTNTGTDFTSAPSVTLTAPPAAVNATATANIGGGKVTSITITEGGSGYKIPLPIVNITGGDGTGAGIDLVTVANSEVTSITVSAGGTGMTLFSPASQIGVIDFAHPGFPRHGRLLFDHDTERFRLVNNGLQALVTDLNGNVAVSSANTDFTEKFTVENTIINAPSRMLFKHTTDKLLIGDNEAIPFDTTAVPAQIITGPNNNNLNIAPGGAVAAHLAFYGSNGVALTEVMRVATNLRVGIGASALAIPDSPLHVAGGSAGAVTAPGTSTVLTMENSTNMFLTMLAPDGSNEGFLFMHPTGGIRGGFVFDTITNVEGVDWRTGGNVVRMTLDSAGNLVLDSAGDLGIGTTSLPTERVVVDTSGINDPSRILMRNSTTDRFIMGYDGTDAFRTTISEVQVVVPSGTGDLALATRGNFVSNILFYTSDGSPLVERMRIDSIGNVGIGISPNSKLQVDGSVAVKRVATAVSIPTADEVIIGVTDTSVTRTITIQTADIVVGRIFIIKDESGAAGTNNITIDTQGAETIDGAASVAITADFGAARLYSDGSNLFLW